MNLYQNIGTKARKQLGFNDIPLMLFGIPALSFIMPMLFFNVNLGDGFMSYCPHWFVGILFTSWYWVGNRTIMVWSRKRYSKLSQNMKRVFIQSMVVLIFMIGSAAGIEMLQQSLDMQPNDYDQISLVRKTLSSLFATFAIVSVYEAIYAISMWRASVAETEKLKRENAVSQLETLKSQVNPHFLFNSLNTLASIIPEDGEKAVMFVQNLSKVYRYILEIRERELITLSEELEAIKSYSFLVHARFGENLRIHVDIPEKHKNKYLVPLSVQMLLENAIKHNVVSGKRPLTVEIGIDKNGDLMVRNNLQKKDMVSDSTGIGLKNISNRYKLVSGKDIEVIVSEDFYTVILPLLKVTAHADIDH